MKEAPTHLLYESAHRGNIIPLTSACNVSCVFCSHKQNPPGIQIYRIPSLNPGHVPRLAPESLHFPPSLWQELHSYVASVAANLQVSVTVEPGLLKDLNAEVNGVIQGSPAAAAGLAKKNIIARVNGEKLGNACPPVELNIS